MAIDTENRDLLLNEVRAVALVANSPTFLLRRLQEIEFVRALAKNHNEVELCDAASKAIDESANSAEAPYLVLANLAALGLEDVTRVAVDLSRLDLSTIPWGDAIRKLLLGQVSASNSVHEFNISATFGAVASPGFDATSGFLDVNVLRANRKKSK